MMRRPCAYLRASRRVVHRHEESIHTRLARADRLLLHAADRADLAVEEDLAGRGDLETAVDVRGRAPPSRRARTRDRPTGRRRRSRRSRRSRGSRMSVAWSRNTPTIARCEPGPAATVLTATTSVRSPPRSTVKRTVRADAPSGASRRETSCGRAHRRAVDRDDHVGRVRAARPPAARAGRPRRARRSGSRAPSARARAARPRRRSAASAASRPGRPAAAALSFRPGGTTSCGLWRSAPSCRPPNSRSSSVALRTIDVDEVDAAAVARIVAAARR